MEFMFPIVILAAGLILIFSLSKENKVFYVAGGYFILLGGWLMADKLLPEQNLFAGTWGIVFKVITGVILVVLVAVFAKEYRKKGRDAEGAPQEEKPDDNDPDGLF